MDKFNVKTSEEDIGPSGDIDRNSSNPDDTASNKTDTNTTVVNIENHAQPAATCVASQSLLDILGYGGSSSSDDSEPESADIIQDSKSSDSSSDSEWDEIPSNNENVTNDRNYRNTRLESGGSSSDSNESLDDDVQEVGAIGAVKPIPKKNAFNDDDFGLDDLPPVPDLSTLSLNVKTEDCIQIGKVSNIIDRLVTIDSLPNTPAYDLDTLFFLDQGKVPLGYVHDVIGQVSSPIYVVRFNSKEEIESKGITKGLPVYCAPNTEHTQFVFLKELLRMKGSDASWQGDHEVPLEFLDFSDDEVEYTCPKSNNIAEPPTHPRRKKRNSFERHKIFETTMNLRNEVNNARYKTRDVIDPKVKRDVPRSNLKFHYRHPPAPCPIQSSISPGFNSYIAPNFSMAPHYNMINMSIPPPMFTTHGPQFPMMHFPSPQFPPPIFGSPAIPPLPQLPHVPPQPPLPGYHNTVPMPLAVCRPIAQIPKIHQNTGVVPKIRLPRQYKIAGDINFVNGQSHTRERHPFVNNPRQNPSASLGSLPYNTVTCPYNKRSPPNNTGALPPFKNP